LNESHLNQNSRNIKQVLDHGHVYIKDHMGDDQRVVDSARVSFGHMESETDSARNRKLIFYLMENGHESPFESVVFTFGVKTPIFIARQWFRHRIGSFNEISARYSKIDCEFYIPDNVRKQDTVNKQGSLKMDDERILEYFTESLRRIDELAKWEYEHFMDMGVAREMCRMFLPLNTYTEFYWTVNFRSLMNFIKLRADTHAQWEIQRYAKAICDLVRPIVPVSFEAFNRFILESKNG